MILPSPKNFPLVVFAALCLAIFARAQSKYQPPPPPPAPTPTPIAQDETERVFTEEVKLNVNAFDADGRFVADVKKEDLVILENGRIHQASSLRRVPANVLILLDTGGEMRAAKSLPQTKATARRLIESLKAEDSVAIMQYSDKPEIVAEWTNKDDALKLLNSKTNFGKRSMLYNALDAAARFMQKTSPDNRHLVLITDGTDSAGNLSEKEAMMRNLLTTDITVHVLSYTQMELAEITPRAKGVSKTPPPAALPPEVAATMPPGIQDMNRAPRIISINTDKEFLKRMRARKKSLEDAQKYLGELAADTNGEFILPVDADEMIQKTALVARFVDSSYVVTYAPKRSVAESKSGEVRDISVSSRRPDLQIEAHRKLVVAGEN